MDTIGAVMEACLPRSLARGVSPEYKQKTAENDIPGDSLLDATIKRIQERLARHANDPVFEQTITSPRECPFDTYDCEYCESGLRRIDDNDNSVKYKYHVSKCYGEVRYQKLLEKSGIKGIQKTQTFNAAKIDTYNRQMYGDLRSWNPYSGHGIYITSPKDPDKNPQGNGTGKSYAMCALIHRLCREGIPCLFSSTINFLQEIRSTYSEFALENEIRVFDRYVRVGVLFWDDMGKESIKKDTEWVPEKIYHIINERVLLQRPIVISSNFSIPELEGRFGEFNHGPAIASRLIEHCCGNIYELGGPDRRFTRK